MILLKFDKILRSLNFLKLEFQIKLISLFTIFTNKYPKYLGVTYDEVLRIKCPPYYNLSDKNFEYKQTFHGIRKTGSS